MCSQLAVALLVVAWLGCDIVPANDGSASELTLEERLAIDASVAAEEQAVADGGKFGRIEYQRQKLLARILFSLQYKDFRGERLDAVTLAAANGGRFTKTTNDAKRTWDLGGTVGGYRGTMHVRSTLPGQGVEQVFGEAEIEWRHLLHAYPQAFHAAGNQFFD